MKGFSRANLMSKQAFSAAWPEHQIVQQLVGQLPYVTHFLLELGACFPFVGKQAHIEVRGGDDFFMDLLFYHLKLRCYVVIELKAGEFRPAELQTSPPSIEQIEQEFGDWPESQSS